MHLHLFSIQVLQRCSDVAPTVRIRALGAIQGLLVKLQGSTKISVCCDMTRHKCLIDLKALVC